MLMQSSLKIIGIANIMPFYKTEGLQYVDLIHKTENARPNPAFGN